MFNNHKDLTLDGLTSTVRREDLDACFARAIEHTATSETKLLCLAADLNEFKSINDSHGHLVGDYVLRHYANLLTNAASEGTVVRTGGDEFLALIPCVDYEEIDEVLSSVADLSGAKLTIDDLNLTISASVGGSVFPDDATEKDSLIEMADKSMYFAKRNDMPAALVSDEIRQLISREGQLRAALRPAIEAGDIHLAYQPIHCLRTGNLNGFEALARWTHPKLGAISPVEFIGMAERSGLMNELGWHLIDVALEAISDWNTDQSVFTGYVSINISAIQLRATDFAETLLARMAENRVFPSSIALEITESHTIHANKSAAANLKRLRDKKVQVFLDDFGVGYSSLSTLRDFRFDKVKIDKDFTRSIEYGQNPSSRIIQAILLMAKSLGIKVVAEGIENQRQARFLSSFLCDEGQGNYFSEPLSAENATAMLIPGNEPTWSDLTQKTHSPRLTRVLAARQASWANY